MIRVLNIINAFDPGGIETWLLRMLQEIPRNHVAMDFICKGATTGARANQARLLGASVQHCPLRLMHMDFVGGILAALKTGNYDLLHNHLDVTGGGGVWAARCAGVPIISSFHNTQLAPQLWTRATGARQMRAVYSKISMHYTLKKSDAITGCSRAVLDHLVADHTNDPRCRVLHYGVESHARGTQVQRDELRHALGYPQDTPLVLHVGRMAEQKNHAGLLRIFASVLKQIPRARLILAGDGPLRPKIEQAMERLEIQHAVQLLGLRSDIPRLMTCADVFLFPSFHEGLPVVSLESGGCHLPVVASNIPGTNESIIHGKTGLLHDVHDEQGMAESTIQLLTHPSLAEQIRTAAAERIQQNFSQEASARTLQQVYRDTLAKTTPRTRREAA